MFLIYIAICIHNCNAIDIYTAAPTWPNTRTPCGEGLARGYVLIASPDGGLMLLPTDVTHNARIHKYRRLRTACFEVFEVIAKNFNFDSVDLFTQLNCYGKSRYFKCTQMYWLIQLRVPL